MLSSVSQAKQLQIHLGEANQAAAAAATEEASAQSTAEQTNAESYIALEKYAVARGLVKARLQDLKADQSDAAHAQLQVS